MAQFFQLDTGGSYNTVQYNGSTLPTEAILNFISTQVTATDDSGNSRTNITFPDFLELAGGTMLGDLILNADPSNALGAATKQYVDSMAGGLSPKTAVVAATTAALTATYSNGSSGVGATLTNSSTQAAFALDGVSLSSGQRVLIKDQASSLQNGIYIVTTVGTGSTNWVLTRATDYDTSSEIIPGTYTIVTFGTVNATNMYVMTTSGAVTVGTTGIVFSAFNSAANINVGTGLSKSGNTISLQTPVSAANGGTGVSNSANITVGGALTTAAAFTTSGANALTLTTTGSTNVTLPTSGTLVNTAVTTLSSLASIGTIITGVWNGTLIGGTYGGTGVNNGANTITLAGNLVTSGANSLTLTTTGITNVTFPTSGTLATTSQIPSLPLSLSNGGLAASLTASNGGIFYSTGSAGAILAGTATANQILMSGASAAPAWSTATYPATTTVNRILYSSATNTIGQITSANNGTLITDGSGVPSISSTLPSAVQGNITATGALASGSLATGFTPVTVALGGTGNSSTTAYAVQCGGTTSTGAHQAVSGVGSSGNVLTSNGAGALPTWQAVSMPAGTVLQVVSVTKTDTFTTSSTSYSDLTGMSVSITPASSSNKILILYNVTFGGSSNSSIDIQIVRNSTAIALGDAASSRSLVTSSGINNTAVAMESEGMNFLDSPATTSATTYKLQIKAGFAANAVYVNRTATDTDSSAYDRSVSSLTVMEIKG